MRGKVDTLVKVQKLQTRAGTVEPVKVKTKLRKTMVYAMLVTSHGLDPVL